MPATELSLGVTLAVLGAGLLHAGWNALLKSAPGGDALLDTATVVAGGGVWGLVVLPLVGLPDASAWKFMLVSTFIHWAYYVTLAHAYRTGDLSFAYPLMRGTAPLIAAVLGIVFLREWPTPQVALGIVLICAGIVSIAFVRREAHPPAAAYFALANAAIIAVYTLVDGAGARASGNAASYAAWLTFLEAFPFLLWIRASRGTRGRRLHRPELAARHRRRRGEPRRVRDRALGDDARTGRGRRGAARDVGAVRGADRRDLAQGRLRVATTRRRGERGRRRRRVEALNGDRPRFPSRRSTNLPNPPTKAWSVPLKLPTQVRVVIVGGGIAGASTAYHLAKLGVKDVILLEQGKLTCGTTWHAAGLVGQTRATRNATRMSRYGIELYSSLEKETGLATGWKQCGSLNVAKTPDRLTLVKRQMARAKSFGIEFDFISPAEAGKDGADPAHRRSRRRRLDSR